MRSIIILVCTLVLVGCQGDKKCAEGTVLLGVDLGAAPAVGTRLSISVGVDNAAPVVSEVPVTSKETIQTVAIEFPAGYPEGKNVTVDVTATSGTGATATGQGRLLVPAGCAALTVAVVGNAGTDGGIDGAASPDVAALGMCTSGATTCRERIIAVCSAAGEWQETQECPGLCENGACKGDCAPATTKCTAGGVQTCTAAGAWSAAAPCAGACANGACESACTSGATRCKSDAVETCSAAGAWGAGSPCTNTCREGACGGECKPGSTRCTSKAIETCSPEAKWIPLQSCPFVCTDSACTGECEPTKLRCNAGVVESCDAAGAWQAKTTCEFACAEGACTAKMPGRPGVAPTVLSVSPADGAKVREKESITIIFSEEMDTVTVQAAFKALTAGSAVPAFSWSADKTVLTVNPKFTYPAGSDSSVARSAYAFSLGASAKDANGEALAAAVARSYPLTYRRVTTTIPWVQRDAANVLVSGVTGESSSGPGTWMQIGFSPASDRGKVDAFTTFDLSPLPQILVTMESATVNSEIEVVSGAAAGVGNLRLADITFTPPLTASTYDLPYVLVGAPVPGAGLSKVGAKFSFDVTSAVAADYAARVSRSNRSQFRFLFDAKLVAEGFVGVRLLRPSTNLRVIYLLD